MAVTPAAAHPHQDDKPGDKLSPASHRGQRHEASQGALQKIAGKNGGIDAWPAPPATRLPWTTSRTSWRTPVRRPHPGVPVHLRRRDRRVPQSGLAVAVRRADLRHELLAVDTRRQGPCTAGTRPGRRRRDERLRRRPTTRRAR
ncbi:hypothetical protein ACU686_39700 [Yinghuangia aomiensis]